MSAVLGKGRHQDILAMLILLTVTKGASPGRTGRSVLPGGRRGDGHQGCPHTEDLHHPVKGSELSKKSANRTWGCAIVIAIGALLFASCDTEERTSPKPKAKPKDEVRMCVEELERLTKQDGTEVTNAYEWCYQEVKGSPAPSKDPKPDEVMPNVVGMTGKEALAAINLKACAKRTGMDCTPSLLSAWDDRDTPKNTDKAVVCRQTPDHGDAIEPDVMGSDPEELIIIDLSLAAAGDHCPTDDDFYLPDADYCTSLRPKGTTVATVATGSRSQEPQPRVAARTRRSSSAGTAAPWVPSNGPTTAGPPSASWARTAGPAGATTPTAAEQPV